MLLEGLHIPLTTPFHPDGRLNPHKLAANVVRYSKTPAAGLIVLGPSGEPTLLSDDETREVLRTAAQAAAPEKVLIAGISRDSVHATLALANHAAELGYDAILVGAPSAIAEARRSSRRYAELLFFFEFIADHSPLPIVLAETSLRHSLREVFPALTAHRNIAGSFVAHQHIYQHHVGIGRRLEQATQVRREVTVTPTFAPVTARMQRTVGQTSHLISAATLTSSSVVAVAEPPRAATLRTRTKTVGFQIITCDTRSLLVSLQSGATAIAPAFAAAAPQACFELYAAWKDSDAPLAEEKQARLLEAAALAESLGPGGLKFACDLNGYFGGLPRLPHLPPTGAERAELEQQMKPLRN